jgi:hypothetical protein
MSVAPGKFATQNYSVILSEAKDLCILPPAEPYTRERQARYNPRYENKSRIADRGGWPVLPIQLLRVARPSSAWAGPLTFFHHKSPVHSVTDILAGPVRQ